MNVFVWWIYSIYVYVCIFEKIDLYEIFIYYYFFLKLIKCFFI